MRFDNKIWCDWCQQSYMLGNIDRGSLLGVYFNGIMNRVGTIFQLVCVSIVRARLFYGICEPDIITDRSNFTFCRVFQPRYQYHLTLVKSRILHSITKSFPIQRQQHWHNLACNIFLSDIAAQYWFRNHIQHQCWAYIQFRTGDRQFRILSIRSSRLSVCSVGWSKA